MLNPNHFHYSIIETLTAAVNMYSDVWNSKQELVALFGTKQT